MITYKTINDKEQIIILAKAAKNGDQAAAAELSTMLVPMILEEVETSTILAKKRQKKGESYLAKYSRIKNRSL